MKEDINKRVISELTNDTGKWKKKTHCVDPKINWKFCIGNDD